MGEGLAGLTDQLSAEEKQKISTRVASSNLSVDPASGTGAEEVERHARSPPMIQFSEASTAAPQGLQSLEKSFSWLNVDALKRRKYEQQQEELALLEQQLLVEEKRQREARKKRKERYRHEYIQHWRSAVPRPNYEAVDALFARIEQQQSRERHKEVKDLYNSIVQKQLEATQAWHEKVFPPEEKKGLNLMPELTQEELALYQEKMWNGHDEEIVISLFSVDLMREKLQCLANGAWLNDEVINLYLKLLRKHSVEKAKTSDSSECYFHSTFFYAKLTENNSYTYSNVARWTKRGKGKCDLFSQRLVFFPYNISNTHWTLCVAFMEEKKIRFYDSMAGRGTECMKNVLKYLADESKTKKKVDLKKEEWTLESMRDSVPQQTNGFDCGVFLCIFSLYLSMDQPMQFSCSDMQYFRKRICVDILQAKLAYDD